MAITTFQQYLQTAFVNGTWSTDEVVEFVLPLFEEVLSFHESNMVGSFERPDSIFLTAGRLDIDEIYTHDPKNNQSILKELFSAQQIKGFSITDRILLESDTSGSQSKISRMDIQVNPDQKVTSPVYLPGYSSYEIVVGHHDAQTDIFCLGLILGSVVMGLNLYNPIELNEFADYRKQPAGKNNRIHPTLCSLVTEMTELDPSNRSRDLQEIIHRLKYYRDYDPLRQTDLSQLANIEARKPSDRREFILNKLRNRLFDTSRRNRLLYYRPNTQFVNLTVSSVPMVLHFQSIKPDNLFTWNKEIAPKIKAMEDISLNKYLRFEDHPYLNSQLNNIRLTAESDIKEYGFSQLKLAVAFLHWHNLKEAPNERIQTPLLLLPVKLKRQKSLKEERHTIEIVDNAAIINPILANQLKDLYGIILPESIDFDDISMEEFFTALKVKIEEARQGVILNYIDTPRIKVVFNIARQTINNYKKKLKIKSSHLPIDYSYSQENYKPLGLELFRKKVEFHKSHLEFLLGDQIHLQVSNLSEAKSKGTFHLTDGENNPYSWDFDICNIVLGNFNYKKMSLVSDFNKVAEQKVEHAVFDELFTNTPRSATSGSNILSPSEWYHVIAADPTQTKAVLHSRKGESYIIQGPPGTGKSQTITNLIADFLAQGKSILFVCEKRAALDVVYHRLQQNKLSELCCLIHDSQGDKKEFFKDLKIIHSDFLQNRMDLSHIKEQRESILDKLLAAIQMLQYYNESQMKSNSEAGINTRLLIEKLIHMKSNIPSTTIEQQEQIPNYKLWIDFGEVIKQLGNALEESGVEPILAKHPFRNISSSFVQSDAPFSILKNMEQHINSSVQQISEIIKKNDIPLQFGEKLSDIKNLIEDAQVLAPLAQSENLKLIEKNNPEAQEFESLYLQYTQLQQSYQSALDNNSNWNQKFNRQELQQAISIAEKHEKSFLKFLNSNWRKLKKQLKNSYNLTAHQLQPALSEILRQLQAEYNIQDSFTQKEKNIQEKYHIADIQATYSGIELLRQKQGDAEIDYLLEHPAMNKLVLKLSKLNNMLHQLEISLDQLLEGYTEKSILQIQDELSSITGNAETLKDMLPALRRFGALPITLQNIIRKVPVTPQQAEALMAHKTLMLIMERSPEFTSINDRVLEEAYITIEDNYKKLLKINSDYIRATRRQKFLSAYDLSNTPVTLLNQEQKQLKKEYFEGRRILEHEMSKTMRYKSIREMASNESGKVLKDIKPVWLMSPLSVSDSLPLDQKFFDVVIFDEASQITLEEGIPSLFRAPQTIIVGDDKQMPPSNFFNTKAENADDLESFNGEKEDEMLSADADSLLVQGSRKLHSTMLSWHYRSRYESLISYSNHAFYDAGLLTIPDNTIHHISKPEIEIKSPEDDLHSTDLLLNSSISFHYLPNSVYEARGNVNEAKYIASMVKKLLMSNVNETIGIVAFSQEQQSVIEETIDQLAESDKIFDELLQKAYNRKDENQFTGLFIKNLENVQGDERDIIIMSICYGHDAQKKMIMNFGPINRKGGEKRLNVIFSRAKKHMAVISSIKHHHITNEYNEGANYFKRFLHYAELVSTGNMDHATAILDNLLTGEKKAKSIHTFTLSNTSADIKKELEAAGYIVDSAIGHSNFKCTMGIKMQSKDLIYKLGLLVDDEQHYENNNLVEQYYQRPAILRSFGWEIMPIYAKDWLENKQRVLKKIINKLEGLQETKEEVTVSPNPIHPDQTTTGFTKFSSSDGKFFWEIKHESNRLITRFGKRESKGQVDIKTFSSEQDAIIEKANAIQMKIDNGYIEERSS